MVIGVLLVACTGTPDVEPSSTASPDNSVVKELADRVPDRIRADGFLSFGTDPSYPPMEFVDAEENLVGADIGLAQALAKALGLEPEFTLDAFTALDAGVRNQRYEAGIAAISITADREAATDAVLYLRAGTQLSHPVEAPQDVDQLCGLTVGTLEGSVQVADLNQRSTTCTANGFRPVEIIAFVTQQEVTEALLGDDVDAMLTDSTVAVYEVGLHPRQLATQPQVYDVLPYGIVVDSRLPEFSQLLAETLDHLISSGDYERILAEYGITTGLLTQASVVRNGQLVLNDDDGEVEEADAVASPEPADG